MRARRSYAMIADRRRLIDGLEQAVVRQAGSCRVTSSWEITFIVGQDPSTELRCGDAELSLGRFSQPLRLSTGWTTRHCRGVTAAMWRGRSRPGSAASIPRRHYASSPPRSDFSRPESVPHHMRRIEARLKASPDLSNDLAEILKRASSPDASVHQKNRKRTEASRKSAQSKTKNKG